MKIFTKCLCWVTLWLDACLMAGCLASRWLKTEYSTIGALNSKTPEGMVSIIVVIVWTTSLAICGLMALKRLKLVEEPEKAHFNSNRNRQAFARWRELAIQQMTSASTMMFGLVCAGLAYSLALLGSYKSIVSAKNDFPFELFTGSFAISFLCALFLMLKHLQSFQKTANLIKERDEASNSGALVPLPQDVCFLDGWTWALFRIQLVTFALGGVVLLIFICKLNNIPLLSPAIKEFLIRHYQ